MARSTATLAGPRVGEVVGSATTHFVAQALRDPALGLTLPQAPPFGSFVRVALEEEATVVYGVVYHAETGAIDTAHRPMALNLSRQELREQQPQIFDLLRTDFSAIVTGHAAGDRLQPYLPPRPPMVHDFVYACTPAEVHALTERLEFLRTLIGFAGAPTDELVAACLRRAYAVRGNDRAFLLGAGRALGNLLRADYDRLGAIMGRLQV